MAYYKCRFVPLIIPALLAVLFISPSGACPAACDCRATSSGTIVNCRYQRKQGFPISADFPPDTVELDYGRNNISFLDSIPILQNLQKIVLDNCEIHTIGFQAFANAPLLKNITLSQNNIITIMPGAFEGVPGLMGLYLEDNTLHNLPENVFDSLNLVDLYIEGSSIKSLSANTFSGLTVQHLNMKRNGIARLSADHIVSLKNSLVSLYIDGNERDLQVDAETFKGFNNLEVLSLKSSNLKDIAFLKHVHVKTLYLGGNIFPELDLLPYPNLTSVETLDISGMGIRSMPNNKILYNFKSIRKLDLSKNLLRTLRTSWFAEAPMLTELNAAGNSIYQLPSDLGRSLSQLKSLDLAMNRMAFIESETFDEMTQLRRLDLRNNKLQIFPSTLEQLFNRIPNLLLEGNPLHCNCEMLWYVQWLYTSGRFSNLATMCFTPDFKYIYDMQLEEFVCKPPKITSIQDTVYARPGDDLYLSCVGEGDPAPSLKWVDPFKDSVVISPSDNKTVYKTYNTWQLNEVTPEYNGLYTCTATNTEGSVQAVTRVIVTNEFPTTATPDTATPGDFNKFQTTSVPDSQSQNQEKTLTSTTDNPRFKLSTSGGKLTTTFKTEAQEKKTPIVSQRTLAIIIGVVGAVIIVSLILFLTIHICRHKKYRQRYDVNDKSIIYHADTNELDISKDSKQIPVGL